MFQSIKYSNLFLRLGLSAVFIWFGIDKFVNPQYWLSAWVPQDVTQIASKFGISGLDIIYVSAVFELLVGIGVLTNMFTKTFLFLLLIR